MKKFSLVLISREAAVARDFRITLEREWYPDAQTDGVDGKPAGWQGIRITPFLPSLYCIFPTLSGTELWASLRLADLLGIEGNTTYLKRQVM